MGLLTILIAGCGAPQSSSSSSSLLTSPSSVDFGSVVVGQTSTDQVQITNGSSTPMTVTNITVTGAGFSLAGQTSLPFTLQPNQSTSIGVSFTPATTGTASGTLTLTTNSRRGGPKAVNLTGQGKSKNSVSLSGVTCSSSSLTGNVSDACSVSLTGAAGSGGFAVTLASSSSAVSVPSSVTVAAGASSASFTATASAVSTSQTVTLTASAGGVSETFALQLTAATAQISVSPTSLSFGTVNVGSPSTQSVTIVSSGSAALTISSATVSGTGFSLTGGSFPMTINPGQSASLQITFNPPSTASYTGTLTINSNASSGGVNTVSLSGTGASATHSVSLTWSAPSSSTDPVAGYDIYRALSGSSSYQLLNSNLTTSTSYTDSTVASGQSYLYYVVSVDSSGNQSSPSNTYSVTIP